MVSLSSRPTLHSTMHTGVMGGRSWPRQWPGGEWSVISDLRFCVVATRRQDEMCVSIVQRPMPPDTFARTRPSSLFFFADWLWSTHDNGRRFEETRKNRGAFGSLPDRLGWRLRPVRPNWVRFGGSGVARTYPRPYIVTINMWRGCLGLLDKCKGPATHRILDTAVGCLWGERAAG